MASPLKDDFASTTPPIWQGRARRGESVAILGRNPDGTFQVSLNGVEKTFTEPNLAGMLNLRKGPLYEMLGQATQQQLAQPRTNTTPPIWQGRSFKGEPVSVLSRNPDGTFQTLIHGQEKTRTERDIAQMLNLRKGPLYEMLGEATQRKLAERAAAASAGSTAGSAGSAAGTAAASAAVSAAGAMDGTPGSVPQANGVAQAHHDTSVNNAGAEGDSQPLAVTHGDPGTMSRAIARATADINRQLPGQVGTDTHLFQSAEEFLQSDYARNRKRPFTEAEAAAILQADGFHDPLTGQSIVIAGNVRPQTGESPHQALARVAMHESIGHGGVNRLLARSPQENVRFDGLVQRIPGEELTAIANDPAYAHLKDDRRALALEWLARKTEERPDLLGNPRSHLTKMWDTLRQAVANLQTRLGLKADQGRDLDALVGDMITRARTAALRRGPNPGPAGGDGSLQFKNSTANPALNDFRNKQVPAHMAESLIQHSENDRIAAEATLDAPARQQHLSSLYPHATPEQQQVLRSLAEGFDPALGMSLETQAYRRLGSPEGRQSVADVDAAHARLAPLTLGPDHSATPRGAVNDRTVTSGSLGPVHLPQNWWAGKKGAETDDGQGGTTTPFRSPLDAVRPHLDQIIREGHVAHTRDGLEGEREHLITHPVIVDGKPSIAMVVT